MSYKKRKLEELNVMDDFLMNRLASDGSVGEEFCKVLLSTLLQREIGKVSVTVQKVMPPFSPDRKGIRLDVRVDEDVRRKNGEAARMNVYDVEPHFWKGTDLPRHNRFYQAMADSGHMKIGEKDYSLLPNLFIVMILDSDPFGFDYMLYSIRNRCEEIEELNYEDGLRFYYFYTKGKLGGNEAISTMLRYIRDSRVENATDMATRKLHGFTESVKVQPEVRESYMFWEEYVEMLKEEGRGEEALDTLLDLLSDYGEVPEETSRILRGENDPVTLRKWIKLAAKSDSIEDFIDRMY